MWQVAQNKIGQLIVNLKKLGRAASLSALLVKPALGLNFHAVVQFKNVTLQIVATPKHLTKPISMSYTVKFQFKSRPANLSSYSVVEFIVDKPKSS